jgi:DMSO/TMAO reductase YedYZ molybdopterin-dependent catalytic subunit
MLFRREPDPRVVADPHRLPPGQVLTEAGFVVAHCFNDYTTSLPVDVLNEPDVLLAYRHDGVDLEPDHGGPLRLVVPKKYAWKSAKWLEGLEWVEHDRLGFWERNGYNNSADPWLEERYW